MTELVTCQTAACSPPQCTCCACSSGQPRAFSRNPTKTTLLQKHPEGRIQYNQSLSTPLSSTLSLSARNLSIYNSCCFGLNRPVLLLFASELFLRLCGCCRTDIPMSLAFDEYGRPFIIIRVRVDPADPSFQPTSSSPLPAYPSC